MRSRREEEHLKARAIASLDIPSMREVEWKTQEMLV